MEHRKKTDYRMYLYSQITALRELMISAGKMHGLCSPETLKYSEELDKLIIQAQLLNR